MSVNKTKAFFFDRAAVIKDADKKTRAVLSKFGSFVRRTAKGLIRPAGKKGQSSKPGKPPKSHLGLLKRFIFFSWEPATKSCIIGPAKLNGVAGGNVPSTLEKGGKIKVVMGTRRNRRVARVATIKPRPYMGPAVNKELKTLPRQWANSVRSS